MSDNPQAVRLEKKLHTGNGNIRTGQVYLHIVAQQDSDWIFYSNKEISIDWFSTYREQEQHVLKFHVNKIWKSNKQNKK